MKTTSTGARDTGAERRGSRWTDERIREELQSFLADRTEWPTYREFERNGRLALRDAITQAGGAERWAQEMGVRSLGIRRATPRSEIEPVERLIAQEALANPQSNAYRAKSRSFWRRARGTDDPAIGSATEGGGIAQLDPESIGDGEDTARRVVERRG